MWRSSGGLGLTVFLALCATSLAAQLPADSTCDTFTAKCSRYADGGVLPGGPTDFPQDLSLALKATAATSQPPTVVFEVFYQGPEWIALGGEALLLVDGAERVRLTGSRSQREVLSCYRGRCTLFEGAPFTVPLGVLVRLAGAERVQVRFASSRWGYLDRELGPAHLALIRSVVERYRLRELPATKGALVPAAAATKPVSPAASLEPAKSPAPATPSGASSSSALPPNPPAPHVAQPQNPTSVPSAPDAAAEAIPHYDGNAYCSTVASAAGGGYQLEASCRQQEAAASATLQTLGEIEPRILAYCRGVADQVARSSWFLLTCIKNELKAKADLQSH